MIHFKFGPTPPYVGNPPQQEAQLTGPIVVEDVWAADLFDDGEQTITTIRITGEVPDAEWPGPPFKHVVEYKLVHRCDDQGTTADNWIQLGTDPGEYRCTNCAEWL